MRVLAYLLLLGSAVASNSSNTSGSSNPSSNANSTAAPPTPSSTVAGNGTKSTPTNPTPSSTAAAPVGNTPSSTPAKVESKGNVTASNEAKDMAVKKTVTASVSMTSNASLTTECIKSGARQVPVLLATCFMTTKYYKSSLGDTSCVICPKTGNQPDFCNNLAVDNLEHMFKLPISDDTGLPEIKTCTSRRLSEDDVTIRQLQTSFTLKMDAKVKISAKKTETLKTTAPVMTDVGKNAKGVAEALRDDTLGGAFSLNAIAGGKANDFKTAASAATSELSAATTTSKTTDGDGSSSSTSGAVTSFVSAVALATAMLMA